MERKEFVGAPRVFLCEGDIVARKAGADANAKVVDGTALGTGPVGRAHEGVGREPAEPRLARGHMAHRTAVGASTILCGDYQHTKSTHKSHSSHPTTTHSHLVHTHTHSLPFVHSGCFFFRFFFVQTTEKKGGG